MRNGEYQARPGRIGPCCISMRSALSCGYIKKGYMWVIDGHPQWIYWTLKVRGPGYYDVSVIHFCPFCGRDLDEGDD